jgi:[ribosomal protein S18]-alanine N-acetyltransferase
MTVQSSVAIRPLNYADLPQVLAIERRSFPTPWSLAMFVLELARPSGVCLAVTQEEALAGSGRVMSGRAGQQQLLGYLICSRYADDWHIMNIAVDPSNRRRGLATALLEELFVRAGRDRAYTLEVRTTNDPAIALYQRFGFRPAGTRKGYYQDTGEDALIMWRLGEGPSSSR